jgi:trimethylamine--corrinoid protein Co-methyltransferase
MQMRCSWLSEEEKARVYEGALQLLECVGMRMHGSRALGRLADLSAVVDESQSIVRFPAAMVRDAVARCPRRVLMAGLTPETDLVLDEGQPPHFSMSGCLAKTLDHRTGERRASTLEDIRIGTAVYDETSEVDMVWTFLTANDVPVERRELVEYRTYLSETAKPVLMVDCPALLEPVLRVFEVLAGDLDAYRRRPRTGVVCTSFSPLGVNGELLDLVTELAGYGTPVWVYSMPISGATAPVTLAGTLAQLWAEILGIVTAIQTAHPGASVVPCCGPGVLDMRSTTISLGCLENSLAGVASAEIGHWLGLPVHNAGLHTDAKHAGIQAGYEKALKALATAAGGADILSAGFGHLDSSNTWYLPLIPIEAEIVAMVKRMLAPVEISDQTLMLEATERVGIGGSFLGERETRRRIRAGEHFMPWIGARSSYEAWLEAGRTEIDAAMARIDQQLAAHVSREPYLTDDQMRQLDEICGTS